MTFSRIGRLRLTAACLVVLAAGSLAACAPEPEPTPTPTAAFSSEEEAFAAAEEVYRAYLDAFNQVDLQDPATFEALNQYTTGQYQADEREQLSEMHAEGYTRTGAIELLTFSGHSLEESEIVARSCEDVTNLSILDSQGQSIVAADRPDQYALDITFTISGKDDSVRITNSEAVEDSSCAAQ
ncbi:hypothetical protein [Microbacterium sp. CIAB417]|uniref:hypothetical protein n=1 Tax=Microbacterium sp. CIAB417 TaxID=2860287 RepID=UPI001FAD1679|nr:hypothetical protein [Microbacterium sp. CIAB417]